MKKFVIVIPCRLNSTRLPKKLIKKVNGKEIFLHTFDRCSEATSKKNIYVATDSDIIINVCKKNKINVVKTSDSILTGSDRIFQFSKKVLAKNYINVQGDEPVIDPLNIRKVILKTLRDSSSVYNCFTEINYEEAKKNSIPKLIMNKKKELIYMSRSLIPHSYNIKNVKFFKQICIYSYPRNILKYFNNVKGNIEKNEDIEILRLLENGIKIKMIEVKTRSFAIDTQKDLKRLKKNIANFL